MRRYETIFILRPNAGEEEINRVVESTSKIILDEKGTIIELAKWGMKKLAYLIKKESLGYYVYCDYAGTPAAVSEIERKFRIDDAGIEISDHQDCKFHHRRGHRRSEDRNISQSERPARGRGRQTMTILMMLKPITTKTLSSNYSESSQDL